MVFFQQKRRKFKNFRVNFRKIRLFSKFFRFFKMIFKLKNHFCDFAEGFLKHFSIFHPFFQTSKKLNFQKLSRFSPVGDLTGKVSGERSLVMKRNRALGESRTCIRCRCSHYFLNYFDAFLQLKKQKNVPSPTV